MTDARNSGATSTRAAGPFDRCQPWCTSTDRHAGGLFVEDQMCRSVEYRTALTTHEQLAYSDDETRLDFAAAEGAGQQRPNPRVMLAHDFETEEMYLTPGEARALAGILTHFAWAAESGEAAQTAFAHGMTAGR